MKYTWLDEYCLSKKGVVKEYKLEWDATRYMIKDKMLMKLDIGRKIIP
jgi:hypothetical protein